MHSSAVRTTSTTYAPHHGEVYVSASRDPEGGTEVGTLQASGAHSIESLIPELEERTRELGGNYTRIDRISTRFERHLRSNINNNCGSMRFPMSCGTTSSRPEEVPILVISGRAFLVPEPPP